MSDPQATAPITDNAAAVVTPGQEGSVLTGNPTAAAGATPSAEGAATKELPAWMSQLPVDLKTDESIAKFPNVWDLAKSYKELSGKLSKAVVPPGDTATEEEKASYRKAIGVPEKPEDYKLEPATLPEGLTVDEAMQKAFLKVCHDNDIVPAKANAINQWYMKAIGEQIVDAQKVVKTTKAEAESAIDKKYGLDRDAAKGYMERAFARYATPSLAEKYIKTGLDNDPETIEMFINIGRDMGDHVFVDGSRGEHLESGVVGQRTDEQIAATMYPPEEGQ